MYPLYIFVSYFQAVTHNQELYEKYMENTTGAMCPS